VEILMNIKVEEYLASEDFKKKGGRKKQKYEESGEMQGFKE
jgi:hypothetical protein